MRCLAVSLTLLASLSLAIGASDNTRFEVQVVDPAPGSVLNSGPINFSYKITPSNLCSVNNLNINLVCPSESVIVAESVPTTPGVMNQAAGEVGSTLSGDCNTVYEASLSCKDTGGQTLQYPVSYKVGAQTASSSASALPSDSSAVAPPPSPTNGTNTPQSTANVIGQVIGNGNGTSQPWVVNMTGVGATTPGNMSVGPTITPGSNSAIRPISSSLGILLVGIVAGFFYTLL